jgi:hypothetical protein
VSPVHIPLSSCNKAADTLISWFGEDIKTVVGGERWWQVRGMDGIDAEWITERGYLSKTYPPACKGLSSTDADILRMSDLDAVMVRVLRPRLQNIAHTCIVLHTRRLVRRVEAFARSLLSDAELGGYYFGSIST